MNYLRRALFLLLAVVFAAGRDTTVTTKLGDIIGHDNSFIFDGTDYTIWEFLGIPFAEPPTAAEGRRFKKPLKKAAFTNPFAANKSAPWCFQNPAGIRILYNVDPESLYQSEDCLYMNIFVPKIGEIDPTSAKAVMIWIYGGGYHLGSQDWYDAKILAAKYGIIFVTFNYRISAPGFLSSPKNGLAGNYGLWDQHMAIEWVHTHINRFGGDPNRVTIAGESAGASSVVYQALYEGNVGLFQRAIAQSGSINSGFAYESDPESRFGNFAEITNCNQKSKKKTIKCLQNMDVVDLMAPIGFDTAFKPVRDNDFVTIHPVNAFLNETEEAWTALQRLGKLDVDIGINTADGAMLLGFINSVFDNLGDDPGKNVLRTTFENQVIPFGLSLAQIEQTEILKQLVIHQYVKGNEANNVQNMIQSSVDFFSDTSFNAPVLQSALAHYYTGQSGRLFFYAFDHKLPLTSDDRYIGANHGDELPYVSGIPKGSMKFIFKISVDDQASIPEFTEADIRLSLELMEYWTNFAKTGDPNNGDEGPSSLTFWPEFDAISQKYIIFKGGQDDFQIEERYLEGRMHLWHTIVPALCSNCCDDNKLKKGRQDNNKQKINGI